jgi:hypothetical protein
VRRARELRAGGILIAVLCLSALLWAAERVWQTGTWRDAQVKRPKIVFGMSPNTPGTGAPRGSGPATQEVRTYVIETETVRFEVRENTSVDGPHLDVVIGEPVQFSVEKKTVWVKDEDGREHKLSLVKQSKR